VTTSNGFHAVWRKSRGNDGINRRIANLLARDSTAAKSLGEVADAGGSWTLAAPAVTRYDAGNASQSSDSISTCIPRPQGWKPKQTKTWQDKLSLAEESPR
jgi:hypothetical protein